MGMIDIDFRRIVDNAPQIVLVIDRSDTLVFSNRFACEVLGIPYGTTGHLDALFSDRDFVERVRTATKPGWLGHNVEITLRLPGASTEETSSFLVMPVPTDGDDQVSLLVLAGRDSDGDSDISRKLSSYEYQDPITGLLNRRSLDIITDREIIRAQRSTQDGSAPNPMALLFVMLNDFKEINQIHGHRVGDLILENTGIRIRESVRKSDYVFRWEGTNLVVLLPDLASSLDAAVVAEKIVDAVTVPYRFHDTDIAAGCHIGVSIFPDDAQTTDGLLNCANSAVVEAERHNLDFLLYDEKLHERATGRLALKSSLKKAFMRDEFELFFQPLVHPDGRIAGAEALMRWNHPDRGRIGPGDFIGLAEGSRLIEAIDKVALYAAVRQLVVWKDFPELFISLNISAADLKEAHLPSVVQQAMKDLGLSPDDARRLKLELTESRSLERRTVSEAAMRELADMGVEVWIDDFGTGQSSLSYLKHLPITTVKIDKDFVIDLGTSENDHLYLSGIVSTVRSRDKDVVVEGVGNSSQAKLVEGMDVKYLQGYHFGRPVPATEFGELLYLGRPLPLPPEELKLD